MSIWCSWPHIGTDPRDWHEVDGASVPERPKRGTVLSFAHGFSNHYPTTDGTHERPAVIALAHIAPWCIPGHDTDGPSYSCSGCGEHHDVDTGGWLRLEVAAPETLNFWEKGEDGKPAVEEEGATVVLDVRAVKALRRDLKKWLKRATVEPAKEDA